MGRIEKLAKRYRDHIGAPWQRNLSGDQKTIFVVYPPIDERKLRVRIELFEMATKSAGHGWRLLDLSAGHGWRLLDLSEGFARWMASIDYRDIYFEEPETLAMKLRSDFLRFTADQLLQVLTADDVDENTVVAVIGVGCLYGFTRLSLVLKEAVNEIRGRLVVFFPGEHEENNYRLLGARDGWNYLAVPITLHNGVKH